MPVADKKGKSHHTSTVGRFLTSLVLGANLITLVLLWACCASTWIDPSLHSRIAIVGFTFPAFLLLNVLFLVAWVLIKPRMAVVPLVGMLLCGGYIRDYLPLNLSKETEPSDLRVMTWNTFYLNTLPEDSMFVISDYLLNTGIDIACLQEYNVNMAKFTSMHEKLKAEGYQIEGQGGRAVISRYPILSTEDIGVESKPQNGNGVLACHLQMGGDTITVIDAHLECYNITPVDKEVYDEALHSTERGKMEEEVRYLTDKIGVASRYRAKQVRTLMNYIDSLPAERQVLLCADFNDTPISYAYQTVARRLRNAYREGGNGVGITFTERNFPVRIDHIFHSSQWKCVESHVVHELQCSDHYPVTATLRRCNP